MPIRKIPKNYRNVTGVSATSKAVGAAQFESTLERDFLDILEFSAEVKRFEVQPLKIEWNDDVGGRRSYTPDVLVEFSEAVGCVPWLCEVKYRADLKKSWDVLRPKFRRGIRFARQKGWRFRLITEMEIRTPYLGNVRFLKPFKFREIPESSIERLLGQLQSLQRATPSELLASVAPDALSQAEWLPVLWHLMALHRIGADLTLNLAMDSPIWSVR